MVQVVEVEWIRKELNKILSNSKDSYYPAIHNYCEQLEKTWKAIEKLLNTKELGGKE